MHVTFLTHRLSQAGAGLHTAMLGLAGGLCRVGVKVSALGLGDHTEIDLQSQWHPAQALACTPAGPPAIGYSKALHNKLSAARPDVLHQHGLWTYSSLVGNHWGSRHQQHRVISPHGMLDPWALQQGSLRKRLAMATYERRGLTRAACLHALAVEEARAMRELGLHQPICVIPNGVDLPSGRTHLKPSWQALLGGKPYLLYLGRVHPKKNLDGLLDAWQLCQRSVAPGQTRWQLVIAGWGEPSHEQQLRERLAAMPAGDCHFVGSAYANDKAALYQHATGFVLPSFSEGLPMVVLEAWANQLPVLMTAHCNLPMGFARDAAIEIPTDSQGIAAAIQTLMEANPMQRRAIGDAGYALVEERFSWTAVANQFATLYDWIAQTGDEIRPALPPTLEWAA